MSKYFRMIILFCFLCSSANAITGKELMQKQQNLHEVDAEYVHMSMTLIDRKGRERKRELIIFNKKNPKAENRSLLKFIKPRDINNVGLLTWEHAGNIEDDQWLYLPASKRIKRIAGGGKKNPFMGSDLAFEDMRSEDLESHSYKILREEVIDGKDCWVIESLPSTKEEKRESGYAKRLIWLRKDITYTVKIEFFNRRDKLLKMATYKGHEQLKGTVWRYKTMMMSHPKKKTSTVMQVINRKIDLNIDEVQFSKQKLRRPTKILDINR